jgi:hypothetical protein
VVAYSDPPLQPGTRVRVRQDPDFGPGPWPAEPTGQVAQVDGRAFEEIELRLGRDRVYFIQFDEPQYEADGDGPYTSSEVLGTYLEELPADPR